VFILNPLVSTMNKRIQASVWQCTRQCAAVRQCGSVWLCSNAVRQYAIVWAVRQCKIAAVRGSASGSVWQCKQQCAAVRQCVAARAALCGSAAVGVAVSGVVCSSASVCGSVRQCVAVQQCAAVRAAVCISAAVRQHAAVCVVRQRAAMRQCGIVCGSATGRVCDSAVVSV
jgi:hypothetical protein